MVIKRFARNGRRKVGGRGVESLVDQRFKALWTIERDDTWCERVSFRGCTKGGLETSISLVRAHKMSLTHLFLDTRDNDDDDAGAREGIESKMHFTTRPHIRHMMFLCLSASLFSARSGRCGQAQGVVGGERSTLYTVLCRCFIECPARPAESSQSRSAKTRSWSSLAARGFLAGSRAACGN